MQLGVGHPLPPPPPGAGPTVSQASMLSPLATSMSTAAAFHAVRIDKEKLEILVLQFYRIRNLKH
jgi:hypothetical protein